MKNLIISVVLIASSTSFASTKSVKVIYGDDNRVDVIDSQNSMFVELSKSTAAMIPKGKISVLGNGVTKISGSKLSSRYCKTERFANQPTAANCSGFLVGENLLVTAGHCMKSQSDCDKSKWVFDYKISQAGQTSIEVPTSSVYTCKKVINTVLNNYGDKNDFALVELKKKVTDRRVLDYRKTGKISVGEDLVVIGHPSGLPTKIADGAKVSTRSGKFFSAHLDTYGGNSGSAVFNANTGAIEGILVRGARDYVYDSAQGCMASNVLGQSEGKGEDVTYITNIPELMN
jgi:V8-like Glu-specific endopeptidase